MYVLPCVALLQFCPSKIGPVVEAIYAPPDKVAIQENAFDEWAFACLTVAAWRLCPNPKDLYNGCNPLRA